MPIIRFRSSRVVLLDAAVFAAVFAWAVSAAAQPGPPVSGPPVTAVDSPIVNLPAQGVTTTVAHAFWTRRADATDERIRSLRAPDGFSVTVFARDLDNPRMIAVGADGAVYVTRPRQGDVVRLRDLDGDGAAEQRESIVSGINGVHGIALTDRTLYLVDVNHLYQVELSPEGAADEPRVLIDSLPDGGPHENRTIAVGPDGGLYITIGSLSNAAKSSDSLEATLLRTERDGSGLRIYARNLRNTLGFAWHSETGELWAVDNGIDWLGDDVQPEELNRITDGGDYGWPYCYGDRVPNPTQPPPEGFASTEAYCVTTEPMVLGYTPHSAPMGIVFYTGTQFPEEYRGDAFVAMRGSWNRYPASGYELVRVRFENGQAVAIEPFVTGWLIDDGASHFGRPVGVAVAADGSLLVTDDTNGIIYRISFDG